MDSFFSRSLLVLQVARIPAVGRVEGTVQPPGSKSLSNRALVCAALAQGTSRLRGLLQSEDTEVMLDSWRRLGIPVDVNWKSHEATIQGCGGQLPNRTADLYVANSGTTIRFLTAALAACRGEFRLDGVPRMRERPIGDLLQSLNSVGVLASSENPERPDCPPVKMVTNGIRGGEISVNGSVSSQFLSGLLLAVPYAHAPVTIRVQGELVSQPYVAMTIATMADFGVIVEGPELGPWKVPQQSYVGIDYAIEPDASAASYFWAAAAICSGEVTVKGLNRTALQGDVGFCDVLEKMGCQVDWRENEITVRSDGKLRGVDVDMAHISDTVQTLAAVALFAEGPTRVRGVAHNRFKETDRIGDLAKELRKLGATVEEFPDGLAIIPAPLKPARLATYHDHRMAMSLALVGLRVQGIEIEDPACTGKTYPEFFIDLGNLIGKKIELS